MDTRGIASVALILSLLCSCGSSAGPKYQASQKDASEQIKEISTSQLKDWMTTGQPFTLIDVRGDNEWQAGHSAAAIHISRWTLSGRIEIVAPDKTTS
jgi:outer membrane biogenesis lipoprotein LolB